MKKVKLLKSNVKCQIYFWDETIYVRDWRDKLEYIIYSWVCYVSCVISTYYGSCFVFKQYYKKIGM